MEIHVMHLVDEPTPDDIATAELIEAIGALIAEKDTNVVLSALANLTAHGIASSAEQQDIGCVGWAYRIADHHADHIKNALAQAWLARGAAKLPGEDPLGPAEGSC